MAAVTSNEAKDGSVLVKFAVSPVEPVLKPKQQFADKDLKTAWQGLGKLEACSAFNEPKAVIADVFSSHNVLAKAVHTAFYDHHPLRLTPDAIWQTIVQGFALHVNENAEQLRDKFVKHQGKVDIVIQRPSFVKGSPNNDWPGVFPEFSDKVAEHIGKDKQELLTSDFSTTGPTERIAAQIALMDVVKSYFRFVMMCGCGIPYIELTGTVADWESIRARTEKLEQFELKWWTQELLPVLDQFVAAAKGQADTRFWQSICNVIAGSGFRRPLSGWIQCFFPYISKGDGHSWTKNTYLGEWRKSYDNNAVDALEQGMMFGMDRGSGKVQLCGRGVELKLLPSSLSSVPFVYVDVGSGKSYDMRFHAGLVATVCHAETGLLEPKMGWGVVDVSGLPDGHRPKGRDSDDF